MAVDRDDLDVLSEERAHRLAHGVDAGYVERRGIPAEADHDLTVRHQHLGVQVLQDMVVGRVANSGSGRSPRTCTHTLEPWLACRSCAAARRTGDSSA